MRKGGLVKEGKEVQEEKELKIHLDKTR